MFAGGFGEVTGAIDVGLPQRLGILDFVGQRGGEMTYGIEWTVLPENSIHGRLISQIGTRHSIGCSVLGGVNAVEINVLMTGLA